MKIPYGFRTDESNCGIHSCQAEVVKEIYSLYLNGYSLGRIAAHLAEQGIPSPTGKESWGRAAIDKLLSNHKYLCGIIPLDTFISVQEEKERRSNITTDSQRKNSRYQSVHPYAGKLTCGHCDRSCRRITRPSGEIVWRCADRVENGRKANCENRNSISNDTLTEAICNRLHLENISPEKMCSTVHSIRIYTDKIDILSC